MFKRFLRGLFLLAPFISYAQNIDYSRIRNGPMKSDASALTFASACSAAGTATLAITKTWTGLTTQTCAAPLIGAGGRIIPASGQTVTASVQSSQGQICDTTAGGTCYLTGADGKINVTWYGAAIGVDSTAAFQAAFNLAANTTNNVHILIPATQTMPPGQFQAPGSCYQLSSTVLYNSQNSGHSIVVEGGVGGLGTCLYWIGSVGGTMMRLNGLVGSRIEKLDFDCLGTHTAATGLLVDSLFDSDLTQSGSSQDTFDHNVWGGCSTNGLAFGHVTVSSPDISLMEITHSAFASNGTGVNFICTGNCKNIKLSNNQFLSNGTAINLTGAGYNVAEVDFAEFLGNTVMDVNLAAGYLSMSAFQDEGGVKLLSCGNSTVPTSCHLSQGYFNSANVASDDIVIQNRAQLFLDGVLLQDNRIAGAFPKIVSTSPLLGASNANSVSVTSIGNTYIGTDTTSAKSPFWSASGPQSYPAITTNWGANMLAWTSQGDRGGVDVFTTIPLPQYNSSASVFGPLTGTLAPTGNSLQAGAMALSYSNGGTSGFPRLAISLGTNTWGFANMNTLGQAGTRAQVLAITCDGPHSGEREFVYDLTAPPTFLQTLSSTTGGGGPNPSYWFTCNGANWVAQ